VKARDSRSRTPNRLCVELECRTVGLSPSLTPSASRSLFCNFCFAGLSSGLPGINHRILTKVNAPGVCFQGKLRMRNAVGFPEPGGPSSARYGANGSFFGNQLPATSLRRQSTRCPLVGTQLPKNQPLADAMSCVNIALLSAPSMRPSPLSTKNRCRCRLYIVYDPLKPLSFRRIRDAMLSVDAVSLVAYP
jgi:hypothetical protein